LPPNVRPGHPRQKGVLEALVLLSDAYYVECNFCERRFRVIGAMTRTSGRRSGYSRSGGRSIRLSDPPLQHQLRADAHSADRAHAMTLLHASFRRDGSQGTIMAVDK
jgi:hypothetical protein